MCKCVGGWLIESFFKFEPTAVSWQWKFTCFTIIPSSSQDGALRWSYLFIIPVGASSLVSAPTLPVDQAAKSCLRVHYDEQLTAVVGTLTQLWIIHFVVLYKLQLDNQLTHGCGPVQSWKTHWLLTGLRNTWFEKHLILLFTSARQLQ